MNLTEQNLERLFRFFASTTCAFVSPSVGPETLRIMEARRNQAFFDHFNLITGLQIGPGQIAGVPPQALATFNAAQAKSLQALGHPQIHIRGKIATEDATVDLAHTGVFHNISASEARQAAQAFYQRAFIFVMRGNFYLYTSSDCRVYGIADTVHVATNPVQGREFCITFENPDGADTVSTMEANITKALNEAKGVIIPSGAATTDQAHQELLVWLEMAKTKIHSGLWSEARQAVAAMSEVLETLAAAGQRP